MVHQDHPPDSDGIIISCRDPYRCSDQLTALNRRIASLLHLPSLEADRNPLHPNTLFTAFLRAGQELAAEWQSALALLQELERQTSDALPGIYGDINRHLIQNGVLPKLPLIPERVATRSSPSADIAAAAADGEAEPE